MWNGKDGLFESYVSLRVYGKGLVPQQIGDKLKIRPCHTSIHKDREIAAMLGRTEASVHAKRCRPKDWVDHYFRSETNGLKPIGPIPHQSLSARVLTRTGCWERNLMRKWLSFCSGRPKRCSSATPLGNFRVSTGRLNGLRMFKTFSTGC